MLEIGETQWAKGHVALLLSYWLAAYFRGFFIVNQPMKHLEGC
jgi:hypothetical protein